MATLDVLINPRGAREGAAQVRAALTSMGQSARTATQEIERRMNTLRSTLFSVKAAVAGIGFSLLTRDTFQLGVALERSERQLRAVTLSAAAAREQLNRIRDLGDTFQLFDDQSLVNSFRLLVSNGVPDAERALKTIANAALSTGVDIDTATTAIVAAQERQLRQLGVQLIDLGTGKVLIAFRNIRTEVQKTDQAMRVGLLDVMNRAFPDASQTMGNSMEFQFARVKDAFEDLQVAVLRGGLQDFLTATFRTIADSFDPEEIKAKGRDIADGIVSSLESIARSAAFTIDTIAPLGGMLFNTLGHALDAFSKLPPDIQALGVIGFLAFGTSGRVAIVGALALADALNLKVDEIAKKAKEEAINLAASSPAGFLARLATEKATGKDLGTRPRDLPSETLYLGIGERFSDEQLDKSMTSAQDRTDQFFKRLKQNMTEAKAHSADVSSAAGATGSLLSGTALDENAEKLRAQMGFIRTNLLEQIALEERKRTLTFSPELAEAEKSSLEALQGLEKSGLTVSREKADIIRGYFVDLAKAQQATAGWTAELELSQEQAKRLQAFMQDTADASRNLQDQEQAMAQPIGAARREQELQLGIIRTLEKDRVTNLLPAELEWLMKQAGVIATQETKTRSLVAAEQQRFQIQEETARLMDETRDLSGGIAGRTIGALPGSFGTQTPSRETMLNQLERSMTQQGLLFDRLTAAREVDAQVEARRGNFIARSRYEMDLQIQSQQILLAGVGKGIDARQAEIRALQEIQQLQQKGVELTDTETASIQSRSLAIQEGIATLRTADAINSFVDSFRVGWDTIIRSGEQAYSHLEDSLVRFVQTGKLNISDLVSFIEQEMLRLVIRNAIFQLIGQGSGLSNLLSGGAGLSGLAGAQNAALRGAQNSGLFGPGFATGGSFTVGGSGGTDSQLVRFRGTPGERVTITRPDQQMGGAGVSVVVNNYTQSEVQTQSRQNTDGTQELQILITEAVNRGFGEGRFDKAMRRFGTNPQAVRR